MGQRGFCGGTFGAIIYIVIFYSVLLVINSLISIHIQLRQIIEIIIYITLLFTYYLRPPTFMHNGVLLLYVIIHIWSKELTEITSLTDQSSTFLFPLKIC